MIKSLASSLCRLANVLGGSGAGASGSLGSPTPAPAPPSAFPPGVSGAADPPPAWPGGGGEAWVWDCDATLAGTGWAEEFLVIFARAGAASGTWGWVAGELSW